MVCCGRATTYYSWTLYPWISRIRKLAPLRPTRGRRTRGSSVFASWRHYVLLVDVVPVDQAHSQAGATTSYPWTSYPWINRIRKLAPLRSTRGCRTRRSIVFASWRHYVLLLDVVPVDQSYSQAGATTSYSWTSYPWINHIRKLAPLRPIRRRRTSWINRIRKLAPLRPSRGRRTRGSVIFASCAPLRPTRRRRTPWINHIRKLAPARPTRGRRSGRSVPLSLRVLYVVRRRQRPQSAARRRIRPRLRTVRSVQRYKN